MSAAARLAVSHSRRHSGARVFARTRNPGLRAHAWSGAASAREHRVSTKSITRASSSNEFSQTAAPNDVSEEASAQTHYQANIDQMFLLCSI
jgi:hypothetical protein